jgi:Flp pilus assembly protein CpaB
VSTNPQPRSTDRRISVPGSLPGPRSIFGGLLVLVAMLGTFAVATNMDGRDEHPVVIAARDVPAGSTLRRSDLVIQQMRLSPGTLARTTSDPDRLVGTVLLGPVARGELVQQGAVRDKRDDTTPFEVSFATPQARALGGDLRSGETVDVLAASRAGNDSSGTAKVVASDVHVLRVTQSGTSLGKSGDVTVTLGVASRADAVSIGSAVDAGDITLIRTTGSADR